MAGPAPLPVPGLAKAGAATILAGLGLPACAGGSAAADPVAQAVPVATGHVGLPPSYRFEPAAITVAAGTSVTWANDDHFTHSLQVLDGGMSRDPHVMAPEEPVTIAFTTPGICHFQCHLHPPGMQGTVTVAP